MKYIPTLLCSLRRTYIQKQPLFDYHTFNFEKYEVTFSISQHSNNWRYNVRCLTMFLLWTSYCRYYSWKILKGTGWGGNWLILWNILQTIPHSWSQFVNDSDSTDSNKNCISVEIRQNLKSITQCKTKYLYTVKVNTSSKPSASKGSGN